MPQENNPLIFIKEVAKYFMDFLETDFHKQKLPKRSIQLRNPNNLLIWVNTWKYQSFSKTLRNLINNKFSKDILSAIQKWVYHTNIPSNLLDLVILQANNIDSKQITSLNKLISDEVVVSATLHHDDYDQALNYCLDSVNSIIKDNLISKFISSLEKPLENANIWDENDIYMMEEELTATLINLLQSEISSILKLILAWSKSDINKTLKEVFNLEAIRTNIISFFENFKIWDLFAELFEIERNKTILDRQDFYLYFCDITFEKTKYPLFYIPFSITKDVNQLNIDFDSQIYINKKAIEYILQEYNKNNNRDWSLNTIWQRILYLSQQDNFTNTLNAVLSEICNYFALNASIDIINPNIQVAKSIDIRVSNNCYISLFDKSDEALVNDYEEILELVWSWDTILWGAFNKLIDDFIYNDPKTCTLEVREDWDTKEIWDKLVFQSPIPLNSEQLQILSAIKKEDCKYIIVQGPPGTWKSHTITAVVFNAILQNQSVLVLSDKKEALDVVEDKITETMNKVRIDDNFQNPVLRLGKTWNAYAKILSPSSIGAITNNYLAVKKNHDQLQTNIEQLETTLKEDIELETISYNEIQLNDINEFFLLDDYFQETWTIIELEEVIAKSDIVIELEEFRKICLNFHNIFIDETNSSQLSKLLGFNLENFQTTSDLEDHLEFLEYINWVVIDIKNHYRTQISDVLKIKMIHDNNFHIFQEIAWIYENEKKSFLSLWFFFNKEKLLQQDKILLNEFWFSSSNSVKENYQVITNIFAIMSFALNAKKKIIHDELKFDYLSVIYESLVNPNIGILLDKIANIRSDLTYLKSNLCKYPLTLAKVEIDLTQISTICNNKFTNIHDSDFDKLIRYVTLKYSIKQQFERLPEVSYWVEKQKLENLLTIQMTHIMDGRLVNFWHSYQSTATVIKKIIQGKMKFPKDEFLKLKEAFPCILASIRDYAEYIPLEPEMFDIVIIDEASQVSLSQAFPALLRAKKVLILWDKKQFSNVKTAQARSEENKKYLTQLKDCFQANVSDKQMHLEKLKKFNIKTSILEFFEYISNYNIQLLKYFRWYKEIISYSNKYFYQNSLQSMKIRWLPIDDVLKFSIINHDGKIEQIANTNTLEAEYIIWQLKEIKTANIKKTVGVITPNTNQQKLLVELINKLPEKEYYYDQLKLKIMTFDTCQWEERDIIFYSMVATKEQDRLNYIFIKDLNNVDIEEDWQIKAQRLNVGFSRAKECMHFVLSKPLEDYTGSIWDALKHYQFTLEESKKEATIADVDSNSKMEPEVLNWFYQTDFWLTEKDNITFLPQFELGKYLKQLDSTYNHPKYRVDFLLMYRDKSNISHKVIIEYDWFKEHFRDVEGINTTNYNSYYSEEDIYREKVIESYWYKFLRINKFNIWNNPIDILNNRIYELVNGKKNWSVLINSIHSTINSLQNWDMKECPKCKEIRTLSDFRDDSLASKYWRFCSFCKIKKTTSAVPIKREVQKSNMMTWSLLCPKCSSNMILRNWRRGKFYGCVRFPYCKGTKDYS